MPIRCPARDPTEVFDWPEYVSDGAVFWPDILDIRADNPVWPLSRAAGDAARLVRKRAGARR